MSLRQIASQIDGEEHIPYGRLHKMVVEQFNAYIDRTEKMLWEKKGINSSGSEVPAFGYDWATTFDWEKEREELHKEIEAMSTSELLYKDISPAVMDDEVVCDYCGDHSNSKPNLQCGRSLGVDEHGEETLPPHCTGTYRYKWEYEMARRACPVFMGEGPVCTLCGKYRIAHSDKALDNAG